MANPFRKITVSMLVLAGALFGQQPAAEPAPHYARAYYTKWKPGMAQEGAAFVKGVPNKASQHWVKSDPAAVGQITMTRVLPGGSEIGHDRLRLVITTTPPDLGGGGLHPGAAQFAEAAGMSPANYGAKLRSFMEGTRSEVWPSAFRYGSIQQGDFVGVSRHRVPVRKRAAMAEYHREREGAMRAQMVKDKRASSGEIWNVPIAAEDEPSVVTLFRTRRFHGRNERLRAAGADFPQGAPREGSSRLPAGRGRGF